jgi:hypothetical protein
MERDVFLGPLFTLGAVPPAAHRLNRRLSKALSDV